MGMLPDEVKTAEVYEAVGCPRCMAGYKGRFALLETLPMRWAAAVVPMCDDLAITAARHARGHVRVLSDITLLSSDGKGDEAEDLRATLGISGPWAVSCSVAAANLERAVELCREVIARYAAEGPTEPELEDERQAQAGSYQVGMATNAGIARELVTTLTAGEPISRMDDYPERLLTTSRDEVVEAIRKHIRPSELTLAVAGTLPERSSG
jgi:hypothetical protein